MQTMIQRKPQTPQRRRNEAVVGTHHQEPILPHFPGRMSNPRLARARMMQKWTAMAQTEKRPRRKMSILRSGAAWKFEKEWPK
jgi:hypothetical protein